MTFQLIKDKLSLYTVGIAGCGGLGSNCAVALARVGIGRLVFADFDVVSESNLNRQYYFYDQLGMLKTEALRTNLERIGSGTRIEAHSIKLNHQNIPEIFGECDVVVEAFDLAEMKKMLIETVLSAMKEIPLVCGIGMAGYGNSHLIRMRRSGNLYICGDECTEVSDMQPPLAPRVGMVSNLEANTVLEILLNK